ncbi:MAG: MazF family transcriptional regulator [Moraxellaceae bacterium]|nr:MazF family transcriptional regulator [Moraxellaceae bacterium]
MAIYVPHRNDIIFLDFEPTKGKEIGKYITEVLITNMDEPCVVAASIIQTLSWKERHAKKVTTAQPHVMNEVLLRLLPLIGADELFK